MLPKICPKTRILAQKIKPLLLLTSRIQKSLYLNPKNSIQVV
ncbi:hypothetical protein LEP1GSC116_0957 [Leptospira interrogans serovar Icterohaemorrhagiae str. Verdun HP]|uniref:Uncharacterized protein n=11 Tax=Leptospira interrogans TaxID=173 RepID=A0A0E2DBL7_LEPIR|nr:hypothetical protein G436_2670 [Leptospira interrogans serovar Hardjo str. Norma]EJO78297.1 hypothetical protein LEP1GSC045_3901 [Leptospira interrogans serovar Pomona str. Kennewicki LC82-25]EKN87197.1 hypothetical protein LEP1GSC027_1952 [Leptospira interrogans str. 2002000624]EKO07766.1 hypothetical protein LEP1GSC077_1180 [Leptospira interrogans str. C10069]EKO69900.1 hypothetical protein LEP1GSC069_2123 [Leptospira interrogans serovar Canicola str. Fiocruz LV133]EKP86110.1 hypothetical